MSKPNPFITFRSFPEQVDALEFARMLESEGIPVDIVDASPHEFVDFAGNTVRQEYRVKVPQADFAKVRDILIRQAAEMAPDLPEDYYLLEFTDEELYGIFREPDAWSLEDYVFAQHVLAQRGKPVSQETLRELWEVRTARQLEADEAETGLVILGYGLAITGGLLGILIGWYFWKHKKTNLEGQQAYAYNDLGRQKGRAIFWLGVVAFCCYSLLFGIYWWGSVFSVVLF